MTINLKLTPQRNALLKGYDNEFYALLQLIDENNSSDNTNKKNLNEIFKSVLEEETDEFRAI